MGDSVRGEARILDSWNPLRWVRHEFILPSSAGGFLGRLIAILGLVGAIFAPAFLLYRALSSVIWPRAYFVGHSLGLPSRYSIRALWRGLTQWAQFAIGGWFKEESNWLGLEMRLQEKVARVVGALPREVTVMNGVGVNLKLLLSMFYRPAPVGAKRKIAILRHSFPTARFIVESEVRRMGGDPERDIVWIEPEGNGRMMSTERIRSVLMQHSGEISVLLLEGVSYINGQALDIEAVACIAHEIGAYVLVDDCHGGFITQREYHHWGVDGATTCSYKWGNAGPGGLAVLYVHERHHNTPHIIPPQGWWGVHLRERFKMDHFVPADGAQRYQVSTLPVMQACLLEGSLDLFERAGMANIRRVSLKMTEFLTRALLQIPNYREHFRVLTPSVEEERAGEVVLEFNNVALAKALERELAKHGIDIDARPSPFPPLGVKTPGVLRFGLSPLFNTFAEIARAAMLVRRLLEFPYALAFLHEQAAAV